MKKKAIEWGVIIILSLVLIVISFQQTYLALIFDRICIYTIVVIGLDILFGYTGQISFGHAGFFAIGAYTSAYFSINMGINPFFTMIIGALFSMVFAAIIAIPASKLVKHFLSLLTIAFGQLVYTFVNATRSITGGASGLKNIPNMRFFGYEIDTFSKSFVLLLILVIVMVVIKRNIVNSRIGRAFIAIRENTEAAYSSGINVRMYKLLAFVISACYAGVAGGLYAHLINFISPDTFSNTQSTLFMTILLFGGMATIAGPIIGSIVLVILREILQTFSTYQMLVYGVLILVVLFLLPNGIAGIGKSLGKRITGLTGREKHAEN